MLAGKKNMADIHNSWEDVGGDGDPQMKAQVVARCSGNWCWGSGQPHMAETKADWQMLSLVPWNFSVPCGKFPPADDASLRLAGGGLSKTTQPFGLRVGQARSAG